MFGDLFSQKTDLQLGLVYSSRRKFLVSAGKNTLQPPGDFMTKSQARRSVLNHHKQYNMYIEEPKPSPKRRESQAFAKDPSPSNATSAAKERLLSLLSPLKKSISDGSSGYNPALKNFRKTAKFVMDTVIIEHYWEGNREDWCEEDKAGVHYYVNKVTGEVTAECPWKPRHVLHHQPYSYHGMHGNTPKAMFHKQPSYKHAMDEDVEEEGTGSLVYDNSEVEELFHLLDEIDNSKSPKKATSSRTSSSSLDTAGASSMSSGGSHSSPYKTGMQVIGGGRR